MIFQTEAKLGKISKQYEIINSDLSILSDISFTYSGKFISENSSSSGKEQMSKGFKYYSEGYVYSIKCT